MDLEQNKTGLFFILSQLDTQSAIVAAVVISVITFLCASLIDLCNYIYWSAYFTRFRIPLAYIDQAIIHENGIKYTVILFIPVLAFTWWLLCLLKKALFKGLAGMNQKRKRRPVGRQFTLIEKILMWLCMLLVVLLLLFGGALLLMWSIDHDMPVWFVLYIELVVFVLWTLFRASIGKRFTVSKKKYYFIRIVGCFMMAYLLFGSMYFAGSFDNYSRRGAQTLQIICDSKIDNTNPAGDNAFEAKLILLETEDHYYVREATVKRVGLLQVKIWNDASSCFVDKSDCPVQSIYAELWDMSGRRFEPAFSGLFEEYLAASLIFVVVFIALLSVPMEPKKLKDENKLQTEIDADAHCVPGK